jgi:2-polyprenyl-3-methyl-5-hydroxy-6-metoxy-1,4-benzoquinol methylase
VTSRRAALERELMTSKDEGLTVRARCTVCGSPDSRPFLSFQRYTVLRCCVCTLRYLWPHPSDQEQEELYGETYFGSENSTQRGYSGYLAQADNLRATFRHRLPYLGTPRHQNRLLDVGAATGYFVEVARTKGWRAEGVEYSEWAARYANEVLGVPVHHGTLETVRFPSEAFSTVTMWEVIEHLPNPRRVLREIHRVLAPGGLLHLSTPDAGSLVARLSGKRWLGWRKIPEHLFFFDLSSLDRLLTSEGFQVINHRYVSLTVSWHYALERLGAMVGLSLAPMVPRVVRDASVRINCFYDLMVTARVR